MAVFASVYTYSAGVLARPRVSPHLVAVVVGQFAEGYEITKKRKQAKKKQLKSEF